MDGNSFFWNREDAGQQLAEKLPTLDRNSTIVVALPRGGVPVGAVIAERLGLPLDVVLIRKIGVPGHRELAVGAVTDGDEPQITVNDHIASDLGLTFEDFRQLAARELPELEKQRKTHFGQRTPQEIAGKTVVIVDDGVATGATVRSAIKLIAQRNPKRIILALPVAPSSTLEKLRADIDDVVCVMEPKPFLSVGSYYLDFDQVKNSTVIDLLGRHKAAKDGWRNAMEA